MHSSQLRIVEVGHPENCLEVRIGSHLVTICRSSALFSNDGVSPAIASVTFTLAFVLEAVPNTTVAVAVVA